MGSSDMTIAVQQVPITGPEGQPLRRLSSSGAPERSSDDLVLVTIPKTERPDHDDRAQYSPRRTAQRSGGDGVEDLKRSQKQQSLNFGSALASDRADDGARTGKGPGATAMA